MRPASRRTHGLPFPLVAITSGQDDDPEGGEGAAEGYVAYELNEWAREARVMLQQLLVSSELPHAWEGTDLVAPAVFESKVDALIEQVEAVSLPALDPDADKVLYELSDWSDHEFLQVADALTGAGIAYEFDAEGNLLVLADDEEAAEEVLDSIEFPDALAADAGPAGEVDAQEVLTGLFIASDRLKRSARDHEGVLGLVAAAITIDTMVLPFGFEPRAWHVIGERSAALRAAIEGETASDEEIEEQAAELRDLLRELV